MFFADKNSTLTATIEKDLDNGFWPEFQVVFKPAQGFEVAKAEAGGDGGKYEFLKEKIVGWNGLLADPDTASYLNTEHQRLLNRSFSVNDPIPYHPDLLHCLHSVCLSMIWQKMAGYVRLSSRHGTAPTEANNKAKNS